MNADQFTVDHVRAEVLVCAAIREVNRARDAVESLLDERLDSRWGDRNGGYECLQHLQRIRSALVSADEQLDTLVSCCAAARPPALRETPAAGDISHHWDGAREKSSKANAAVRSMLFDLELIFSTTSNDEVLPDCAALSKLVEQAHASFLQLDDAKYHLSRVFVLLRHFETKPLETRPRPRRDSQKS